MKLLTNEEIGFLAGYADEVKAGVALERETVVRYMELADRYVTNSSEQVEAALAKNRELVESHLRIKNQLLVFACAHWDSEQHFLQYGTV